MNVKIVYDNERFYNVYKIGEIKVNMEGGSVVLGDLEMRIERPSLKEIDRLLKLKK